jgi:anti-sigma-K factor RskA
LAAGAIAASLALVIALRPTPVAPPPQIVQTAPPPVVVAQLTGAPGAALAARYDTAQGKIRLRTDSLPPSDLSPELWVIPADGVPRSLGIVAARGDSDVDVKPELRKLIADGAILAVTMEDAATAPHKAPGSTPIATGKISIL